jgi:hypothetical protein
MFSRREYESYFGKVTDEVWANVKKSIDNAMDKIYEEDHPLDD